MSYYEYMVVPAPSKAPRVKGIKGTDNRFAHGLSDVMNTHAAQGWEYQRAESLPCENRRGFFTKPATTTHRVLVFRRWVETVDTAFNVASHLRHRDVSQPPEELGADLPRSEDDSPAAGSAKFDTRPVHKPLQAEQGLTAGPRLGSADRSHGGPTPQLGPARPDPDASVHRFPGTDRS